MKKVDASSSSNFYYKNLVSMAQHADRRSSRRSSPISLDVRSGDGDDAVYRSYCDDLGAELAGMHIIQMDAFRYSCYLIDGFSVQLSMLVSDASALAVTSANNARNKFGRATDRFQIYSDDVCVDELKSDISNGSTAVFLGNSLPCFGTKHKYFSAWSDDKLLAVVYRDVFDQVAA